MRVPKKPAGRRPCVATRTSAFAEVLLRSSRRTECGVEFIMGRNKLNLSGRQSKRFRIFGTLIARFFLMCLTLGGLCLGVPAWAAQVVFLDFEGGTPHGEVELRPGDEVIGTKGPFSDSEAVKQLVKSTGQTKEEIVQQLQSSITEKMRQDFAGLDITIVTTRPTEGEFSTVDFAAGVMLKGEPNFYGFGVVGGAALHSADPMNAEKDDNAWTFCDPIGRLTKPDGNAWSLEETANNLARVGSHELGHLVGLNHGYGSFTFTAVLGGKSRSMPTVVVEVTDKKTGNKSNRMTAMIVFKGEIHYVFKASKPGEYDLFPITQFGVTISTSSFKIIINSPVAFDAPKLFIPANEYLSS